MREQIWHERDAEEIAAYDNSVERERRHLRAAWNDAVHDYARGDGGKLPKYPALPTYRGTDNYRTTGEMLTARVTAWLSERDAKRHGARMGGGSVAWLWGVLAVIVVVIILCEIGAM